MKRPAFDAEWERFMAARPPVLIPKEVATHFWDAGQRELREAGLMTDATPSTPQPAEYERLAESMGMDLQAFKTRYLTDAPFHALVIVHLARERELREALERLYIETDRPYAVYCSPAVSTMEQLVRFENARIEAARVIGLERIKALLARPAAEPC